MSEGTITITTTNSTTTDTVYVDSTNTVNNLEGLIVDPQPKKAAVKKPETLSKAKIVRGLSISRDEIIIVNAAQPRLYFHNRNTKHSITELIKMNGYNNYGSHSVLQSNIMFDKNMNIMIHNDDTRDFEKGKKISGSPYKRLPITNLNTFTDNTLLTSQQWIIVDRKKFIESKGKVFGTKKKSSAIKSTSEIKRKLVKRFQQAEKNIEMLKNIVGSVYDEDMFEVIYSLNFHLYEDFFEIYVQLPNLIIKNSIELEHKIDNLVVRLEGEYHKEDDTFSLRNWLYGSRLVTTEKDLLSEYTHSHIPSGSYSFNSFCMGYSHFLSDVSHIGAFDLEAAIVALHDHVAWESLEGGPHFKMEYIGYRGTGANIENDEIPIRLRNKRSFVERVLDLLNTKDVSLLKPAFRIGLEGGNRLTYSVNKKKFTEIFVSMFTEEEVKRIISITETNTYLYDKKTGKFSTLSSEDRGASRLKIRLNRFYERTPPVYMNGKYLRPEVIERTPKNKKIEEGETIFFMPGIVYHIAGIIMYHLLDNLKKRK